MTTLDERKAKPTLVIGGNGKTGRRVAARLRALDCPVRIGSRAGDPRFDWTDEATWTPALEGVGAAYIAFQPDLAAPGSDAAIRGLVERALAAGVTRLVLMSGRGEPEAEACERILQGSGADWTIVRASWFAQNFSEDFMREPLMAGELALPAGDVQEPFIDADDIADVAVAALTSDGHIGKLYEVTGPRLLTFAEAVAEMAEESGRPMRYATAPIEPFLAAIAADGTPPEFVGLLKYLFGTVLDGRNANVTDDVRQALGRPAKDFRAFARDAAAAGAWAG